MKVKNLQYIFLLILSVVFYFFALDSFPYGFSANESLIGWRSWLIKAFMVDELGNFPLFFVGFRGFQLPVQTYLSVVFFGWKNLLYVRAISAFFAVVCVLAIYKITRFIFKNSQAGFYAAFFATITPWLFWIGRISSDVLIGLGFFLIYFYLFLEKKKYSLVFLLLSALSSTVIWWFAIPFFIFLALFNPLGLGKSKFAISSLGLVMGVVLVTLLVLGIKPIIEDMAFFSNEVAISGINQMVGEELKYGIPLFAEIFYNKSLLFFEFVVNYLNHFSPYLLFGKGSTDIRSGIVSSPVLLLSTLPLLIMGIKSMHKHKRFGFLVVWLAASALPSALFTRGVNPEKFIFALVPITVLIGGGFVQIKRNLIRVIWLLIVLFELSFSIYQTIIYDQSPRAEVWHANMEKLSQEISVLNGKVWLTDGPNPNAGVYLAYYGRVDPQETNLFSQKTDSRWINKVGNVTVGDFNQLVQNISNYDWLVLTEEEMRTLNMSNLSLQLGEYYFVQP